MGKIRLCCLLSVVFLLLCANSLQASEDVVPVSEIRLTGNTVIASEELRAIVGEYEGKGLSLPDLQVAASLISEEYKKRGYIHATAYLPEQVVTDGVVEIAILEGRLGEIRVEGNHKYYSTEFIKKHFDPIVKRGAINQDDLERALLVLNGYPKLYVKATLQTGSEPGTIDIIIKAENSRPINVTLDYNNYGSRFVSRSRYGITFEVGNLIKEGSLLSLRAVTGDEPNELFFYRGQYTIPIGTLGTKAGVYYAAGDFDVGREFAVLDFKGEMETFGIFLAHPLIKKRVKSLYVEVSFDSKQTKQSILGLKLSEDNIRSLRGGLTYESTGTSGRTAASFFVTQGLGEGLGAMSNDDPFASRIGADNSFTKFNVNALRLQRIAKPLYVLLKLSGQLSSDSLVVIEQFPLGGADSVRGYPKSEILGDIGYAATAELRLAPFKKREIFQFVLFIDNGRISVKNPLPGQEKSKSLTGGGMGVRMSISKAFDLRADVGFPLWPEASSEGTDAIFYAQIVKKF